MFVNIITPCIRPENLHKIVQSIKLSPLSYQWIIVHDADKMPTEVVDLPIEGLHFHFLAKVEGSISGNGQRNMALDLLEKTKNKENAESWIYFNDDDTAIHPNLWEAVEANPQADFIHFKQETVDGSIRLDGKEIVVTKVDSHNFIFKTKLLGNTRWRLDDYCADGYFAEEIYRKAKTPLYIDQVLSTYNSLR
jgi:hypothetical protein